MLRLFLLLRLHLEFRVVRRGTFFATVFQKINRFSIKGKVSNCIFWSLVNNKHKKNNRSYLKLFLRTVTVEKVSSIKLQTVMTISDTCR